ETPLEFQPATEFETPVEFQPPTEFETPVEFHPPTELETPARSETASKSERAAQAHAGPEPAGVPQSVVPAHAVTTELSFERLIGLWPDVLDTVRASNAMLGAVVDVARPVELAGDRLVLAFAEDADFQRRKAEEPEGPPPRGAGGGGVRAVTRHALTFSYEQRQGPPAPLPLSDDELVARLKDE